MEDGGQAEHPHIVGLGVALPLIVLLDDREAGEGDDNLIEGDPTDDEVLPIATRPSTMPSAMARCQGVLAMEKLTSRWRKMVTFSIETLTTPRSSL